MGKVQKGSEKSGRSSGGWSGGRDAGHLPKQSWQLSDPWFCYKRHLATRPPGPVPHDHRPPHPRPAKACPHPPGPTSPSPPAVTATRPTAGFWEEAQDLSSRRGLRWGVGGGGWIREPSLQQSRPLSTHMEASPKAPQAPVQPSSAGPELQGHPDEDFSSAPRSHSPQRKSLRGEDHDGESFLGGPDDQASHMWEGR